MENNDEIKTEMIAQTENFLAWKAKEPDDEVTYHLEINNLTIHFFQEEWVEFIDFKKEFVDLPAKMTGELVVTDNYAASCDELDDGSLQYTIEIPSATLYMFEEDWQEFCDLIRAL